MRKDSSTFPEDGSDPEKLFRRQQIARSALDNLMDRERAILELKHYHGMRLKTIASILSCSELSVRYYLYRGIQKLRAMLSDVY